VGSLIHSLTFIYIASGLTLFFIGKGIYLYNRGESIKRLVIPTALLGLGILGGGLTWGLGLAFLLGFSLSPLLAVIEEDTQTRLFVAGYFLGPPSLLCLLGSSLVLLDRRKNSILNCNMTFMILSLISALFIGFLLTAHERILYDLSILLPMSGLTLLGIYLKSLNLRIPIHRIVTFVTVPLLVIFLCGGIFGWVRNYTAYRDVDIKVVEYMNGKGNVSVLASPQIYAQVYRIFTKGPTYANYGYSRELEYYDYFVFRDEYMDCKVEYYGQEFPPFNLPGGLTLEKEFEAEDIRIEVYKVGKEEKE